MSRRRFARPRRTAAPPKDSSRRVCGVQVCPSHSYGALSSALSNKERFHGFTHLLTSRQRPVKIIGRSASANAQPQSSVRMLVVDAYVHSLTLDAHLLDSCAGYAPTLVGFATPAGSFTIDLEIGPTTTVALGLRRPCVVDVRRGRSQLVGSALAGSLTASGGFSVSVALLHAPGGSDGAPLYHLAQGHASAAELWASSIVSETPCPVLQHWDEIQLKTLAGVTVGAASCTLRLSRTPPAIEPFLRQVETEGTGAQVNQGGALVVPNVTPARAPIKPAETLSPLASQRLMSPNRPDTRHVIGADADAVLPLPLVYYNVGGGGPKAAAQPEPVIESAAARPAVPDVNSTPAREPEQPVKGVDSFLAALVTDAALRHTAAVTVGGSRGAPQEKGNGRAAQGGRGHDGGASCSTGSARLQRAILGGFMQEQQQLLVDGQRPPFAPAGVAEALVASSSLAALLPQTAESLKQFAVHSTPAQGPVRVHPPLLPPPPASASDAGGPWHSDGSTFRPAIEPPQHHHTSTNTLDQQRSVRWADGTPGSAAWPDASPSLSHPEATVRHAPTPGGPITGVRLSRTLRIQIAAIEERRRVERAAADAAALKSVRSSRPAAAIPAHAPLGPPPTPLHAVASDPRVQLSRASLDGSVDPLHTSGGRSVGASSSGGYHNHGTAASASRGDVNASQLLMNVTTLLLQQSPSPPRPRLLTPGGGGLSSRGMSTPALPPPRATKASAARQRRSQQLQSATPSVSQPTPSLGRRGGAEKAQSRVEPLSSSARGAGGGGRGEGDPEQALVHDRVGAHPRPEPGRLLHVSFEMGGGGDSSGSAPPPPPPSHDAAPPSLTPAHAHAPPASIAPPPAAAAAAAAAPAAAETSSTPSVRAPPPASAPLLAGASSSSSGGSAPFQRQPTASASTGSGAAATHTPRPPLAAGGGHAMLARPPSLLGLAAAVDGGGGGGAPLPSYDDESFADEEDVADADDGRGIGGFDTDAETSVASSSVGSSISSAGGVAGGGGGSAAQGKAGRFRAGADPLPATGAAQTRAWAASEASSQGSQGLAEPGGGRGGGGTVAPLSTAASFFSSAASPADGAPQQHRSASKQQQQQYRHDATAAPTAAAAAAVAAAATATSSASSAGGAAKRRTGGGSGGGASSLAPDAPPPPPTTTRSAAAAAVARPASPQVASLLAAPLEVDDGPPPPVPFSDKPPLPGGGGGGGGGPGGGSAGSPGSDADTPPVIKTTSVPLSARSSAAAAAADASSAATAAVSGGFGRGSSGAAAAAPASLLSPALQRFAAAGAATAKRMLSDSGAGGGGAPSAAASAPQQRPAGVAWGGRWSGAPGWRDVQRDAAAAAPAPAAARPAVSPVSSGSSDYPAPPPRVSGSGGSSGTWRGAGAGGTVVRAAAIGPGTSPPASDAVGGAKGPVSPLSIGGSPPPGGGGGSPPQQPSSSSSHHHAPPFTQRPVLETGTVGGGGGGRRSPPSSSAGGGGGGRAASPSKRAASLSSPSSSGSPPALRLRTSPRVPPPQGGADTSPHARPSLRLQVDTTRAATPRVGSSRGGAAASASAASAASKRPRTPMRSPPLRGLGLEPGAVAAAVRAATAVGGGARGRPLSAAGGAELGLGGPPGSPAPIVSLRVVPEDEGEEEDDEAAGGGGGGGGRGADGGDRDDEDHWHGVADGGAGGSSSGSEARDYESAAGAPGQQARVRVAASGRVLRKRRSRSNLIRSPGGGGGGSGSSSSGESGAPLSPRPSLFRRAAAGGGAGGARAGSIVSAVG